MANMTKSQRRPESGPARRHVRRAITARRATGRTLLDLTGRELYAVISYRLAMAVLGLVALIYVTH